MSKLIDDGIISELKCGSDFAYIINDESLFLPTEYKVLQNQWNNSFVKCMRLKYNGKIELMYLAGNAKPLSSLIVNLSGDNFIALANQIFEQIIAVNVNGFISCKNIDLSFDRIFVEPNSFKVSFIYLPIRAHVYDDDSMFENELRSMLIKTIFSVPGLSTPRTNAFVTDLQNGSLSLKDIYCKYSDGSKISDAYSSQSRGGMNVQRTMNAQQGQQMMNSQMQAQQPMNLGNTSSGPVLIAMNGEPGFNLHVTKADFTIGKKESEVDGVISYNKMISRRHCKIVFNNGAFFLVDLASSNGTFINGNRLAPDKAYPIKNGDMIRLADSDFSVRM